MAISLFSKNRIIDAEKAVTQMITKCYNPLGSFYETKLAAKCKEGWIEETRDLVDREIMKNKSSNL